MAIMGASGDNLHGLWRHGFEKTGGAAGCPGLLSEGRRTFKRAPVEKSRHLRKPRKSEDRRSQNYRIGRRIPQLACYFRQDWVGAAVLGKPEEIAEYAAFMVSDRNSFMNGEVVIVDGGAVT